MLIEFSNLVQKSSNDSFTFALVSKSPCSAFFRLEPSCFSSASRAAATVLSPYQLYQLYQCQLNTFLFRTLNSSQCTVGCTNYPFMVILFLMPHQVGAIFKSAFHREMKNKSCCRKICSDARGVYISYE